METDPMTTDQLIICGVLAAPFAFIIVLRLCSRSTRNIFNKHHNP